MVAEVASVVQTIFAGNRLLASKVLSTCYAIYHTRFQS